jgi:hypothetical protein
MVEWGRSPHGRDGDAAGAFCADLTRADLEEALRTAALRAGLTDGEIDKTIKSAPAGRAAA